MVKKRYRAPNTDLSMLCEFLTNILRNVRKNTVYMCGDFKVDLLQFDKHGGTNDFIDQIYTLELHPLITRPTRITSHSKTLIDNIFTSDLSSQIHSGLIINDMSDHLPIYQITEYAHCRSNKIQDINQFIGNHVGWIGIYIIHNTIQAS